MVDGAQLRMLAAMEIDVYALRARAQVQLGAAFDIRRFHGVVLGSGSLPLTILEKQVDAWIALERHATH